MKRFLKNNGGTCKTSNGTTVTVQQTVNGIVHYIQYSHLTPDSVKYKEVELMTEKIKIICR